MSKSKSPVTDIAPRQGEGFLLDSKSVHRLQSDGAASVKLGVNIDSAPAPDRRYVADVYALRPAPGGYLFLFAQEKLGGGELRSLVLLQMSADGMQQLFGSLKAMKGPSLREIGAMHHSKPEAATNIAQEPEQTVSMKANLVTVAVSNGDAALDFYQISPFALHAATKGGRIQVNPVVRIEIRTGQLQGMVDLMEELKVPLETEGNLR
jgi:hypothetical protein